MCEENQELDERYEEALKVVVDSQSASASFLQRRLKIGYNRAYSIIEQLEKNGVIGPANGSSPRLIFRGKDH